MLLLGHILSVTLKIETFLTAVTFCIERIMTILSVLGHCGEMMQCCKSKKVRLRKVTLPYSFKTS